MELKRTRVEDANSFEARFEVQDKPRFKKRLRNQSPPNPHVSKKVKGLHPSFKREKVVFPMLRSLVLLSVVEHMKTIV